MSSQQVIGVLRLRILGVTVDTQCRTVAVCSHHSGFSESCSCHVGQGRDRVLTDTSQTLGRGFVDLPGTLRGLVEQHK